jgi:hypothetical protein
VRLCGSKSTNCSHCWSLKSVGYAFRLFMPSFYIVMSFFTNTL